MLRDIASDPRILVVLFVVWLAAYVGGMILGKPSADRSRRLPLASRLIMIGVALAFGAFWWLGVARGTPAEPYALWIFLGLLLGAVGDLLLGGVFIVPHATLMAMGAFGIGHLCYIAAIFTAGQVIALDPENERLLIGSSSLIANDIATEQTRSAVASLIIGSVIWALLIRNPGGSRALNIGSLVYGTLLFLTAGLAVGLAAVEGAMAILAAGLILFALSDVILAQYLVRRRRFPYIRDVVWIIYSAAQLLIACSSFYIVIITSWHQ